MENIKIIDDFFNEHDLKKINDHIKEINWMCQCHYKPNVDKYADSPYWKYNLDHEEFFSIYLKKIIEKQYNSTFVLNRVYLIGQDYEQFGNYHYDSLRKDEYTFCLYLNNLSENSGGYFYYKDYIKKYTICIEPIMNRGVLFKSKIIHKGTGFNRLENKIRLCITWKFVKL